MPLRVTREGDGCLVADKIEMADTFFRRLRGLMFREKLAPGEGLLLSPCNQIHMMFMRFPIDAAFLNQEDRVIHCYHSLRPWWGLSKWHQEVVKVLELSAETLSKVKIQPGDRLLFELI